MNIRYPSGQRTYPINSPWRQNTIKSLTRKSNRAFANSSSLTSERILEQVCKIIKEMKGICSDEHDSILRDTYERVKHFKLSRFFDELVQKMPFLIKLLVSLVGGSDDSKRIILVSVIASMLLKNRFSKMGLLQRVISILLYGNGCSKQV